MSKPISEPVFDIGRDLQRAYDEGYKQGRYDEKVGKETSLQSKEQTHEIRTQTHAMRSDTISRADAIEQIQTWAVNLINPKMLSREDAIYILESMPSAQPERKKGKWILTEDDNYEYCTCSECGYQNGENWINGSDIPFCAVCGADMRGEENE